MTDSRGNDRLLDGERLHDVARAVHHRPNSGPDSVDADLDAAVALPLGLERAQLVIALAATGPDVVLHRTSDGLTGDDATALLVMTAHWHRIALVGVLRPSSRGRRGALGGEARS